jgi:hypothetical protein
VVPFLTDPDLVDRAALLSAAGFAAALERTDAIRAVLAAGGHELAGWPRGADAGSSRLDRFAGSGWLVAGDPVIACDPLASQSILRALYTGMKAGQALDAKLAGAAAASTFSALFAPESCK